MGTSATYLAIKAMIENRLLVIRYVEFETILNKMKGRGEITEEESKDLLKAAEHLKLYSSTTHKE